MSAPTSPDGGAAADAMPFTAQLRARAEGIRLGADDAAGRWTLRVQIPEVWDVVRVSAPSTLPVAAVKEQALAALYPDGGLPAAFVLKLHGVEVLDESVSLADSGAADGSIFLLTHRRRRPVR